MFLVIEVSDSVKKHGCQLCPHEDWYFNECRVFRTSLTSRQRCDQCKQSEQEFLNYCTNEGENK